VLLHELLSKRLEVIPSSASGLFSLSGVALQSLGRLVGEQWLQITWHTFFRLVPFQRSLGDIGDIVQLTEIEKISGNISAYPGLCVLRG
jgi:hypothetical protein